MMRRTRLDTALLVCAVALVFAEVVHALSAAIDWGFLRGDKATDWTQALVSALAIGIGAFAIWWQVRRQHTEDRNQRRAEEVRRLQIIASGMFHCRVLAESMLAWQRQGLSDTSGAELIQHHTGQLAAIEPLEVPDWMTSFAISRASGAASKLAQHLCTAPPPHPRNAETHTQVALMTFEAAESIVRTALRSRGADVPAQTVIENGVTYRSLSVPLEDPIIRS
jgi:ABC-type nickel/cobalt efflux system permease component RcnA